MARESNLGIDFLRESVCRSFKFSVTIGSVGIRIVENLGVFFLDSGILAFLEGFD